MLGGMIAGNTLPVNSVSLRHYKNIRAVGDDVSKCCRASQVLGRDRGRHLRLSVCRALASVSRRLASLPATKCWDFPLDQPQVPFQISVSVSLEEAS